MKNRKSRLKMQITKRNCKNLTDVRTVIALSRDQKYKKFPNHQRVKESVFNSYYSWQARIAWIDRIINWKGSRGENLEWQKVLHNSDEIGERLSKEKSERIRGKNNPAYNHGGRLSPFSDKFIGKTSKDEVLLKVKQTKNNNPQNENTRVEYYLNKGMGLCQAIAARKERQAVGSLENFIKRYGEELGRKKWKERQLKWINSKPNINYSRISQQLFDSIVKSVNGDFYYATYDRDEMRDYKNKEYILKTEKSFVRPDFICLRKKKIIEFDGDYWHNENIANPSRENERNLAIINCGYDILHIKEHDYRKNPDREIEKCITFLTS